jgi:cytochrome c biogenesis protein
MRDLWQLLRWAWFQLTSMRVALLLLFLLALASVPGSLVPQRETNPLAATDWAERYPALAPWAERLGLFDVYATPWFAAVYLLLLVSLVGCILPRARQHWRALRSTPPAPPQRLDRLPALRTTTVAGEPATVQASAEQVLRRRGYRVAVHPGGLGAERGYLKETGNLVFHLAIVVVLLAVSVGTLASYRATVLVVEGGGFANTPIQYDDLSFGPRFNADALPPFTLQVDEFVVDFVDDGPNAGSAEEFIARGRLERTPGAPEEPVTIRVNDPLEIDGTSVHLLNPGYAPVVTVRDADGEVLFSDPVAFLPQDASFTSTGVVKVPRPDGPDGPVDLGIEGLFLPTAIIGENGPQSVFPELRNPVLVVTAYVGDLGLDDGVPQSVYRLDTDAMTQLERSAGEPFRAALSPGQTVRLPDGLGTISFDEVQTWVNLQVGRNGGREAVLAGSLLALLGLLPTLFVRRRRVWVVVSPSPDAASSVSTVSVAGLDRATDGSDVDLADELDAIITAVETAARPAPRPEEATL